MSNKLKNLLLISILTFLSSTVRAEWIEISETASSVIYIDPITILKVRGNVRVWTLWDQKSGGSDKQLIENNCETQESRTVSYLMYEGRMGQGKMWLSNEMMPSNISATSFKPVVPGTAGGTVLREICDFINGGIKQNVR
jgi:hypothetical protein